MGKFYLKILGILISLIFLVSCLTLLGTKKAAGLRVTGAFVQADVSPGDAFTHNFVVSLGESDTPVDIKIEACGMGQSADGAYQSVTLGQDTGPFSAGRMISLDKDSFHLGAGESQDVVATINIPLEIAPGGHYAIIRVYEQSHKESSINMASAIDIPIYLTVRGDNLIHNGEITQFIVEKTQDKQLIHLLTTVQNTGNHHFKVKGEMTVSDEKADLVDIIHVAETSSSIIPGMLRVLDTVYIPRSELADGTYIIKVKILSQEGAVLDEATGILILDEPYSPPPAPASAIVTQTNTSVLETKGGEISIVFPAGSVASQTEVTLRQYPVQQIPSLPEGFKATGTVFRVDGIAGNLNRAAIIMVKYSQAELDKAEGDASRLRLARWDDGDGKWHFLKTHVDARTASLNTESDQFSIWAIIVAPRTKTVNWWLAAAYLTGVGILAGLASLVISKKWAKKHIACD